MKITTLILFVSLMSASAASFAQRLTLKEKSVSIERIFSEITRQTGYKVLCDGELLADAKNRDVNVTNGEVTAILKTFFTEKDIIVTLKDNVVVVKKEEKTPSFLDLRKPAFNNIDARGKVLDEKGKPLEGATVVLKGTSRTAKTDAKGDFVLANVPDDGVLVIRYVGYKQLEIELKDAVMPLEIKLNVQTGELEEVKVVYNTGYQELNKERATGSFVQINNELFNRNVGPTVLDRVADLVPGLLYKRGGEGGDKLDRMVIRGVSTFDASTRPLVVVDNFIYDGDPDKLNPNDVESITILKDAAAASIYGAKAGNGVIVITMKKGKMNSVPTVDFNSNVTVGEKPDLFSIPVVPSSNVIALEKKRFSEGYYNSVLNDNFSFPALSPIVEIMARQRAGYLSASEANEQISIYEQHDVRDDVNKYLLQETVAQQYSLGISGGTNNYRYYGSLGYDRNRPNDINMHSDRLTLRFSNMWNPIKNLEISAILNWNNSKEQNNNSLGSYQTIMISPYQRIADDDGHPLIIPKSYRMAYADTINFPGKLDWLYRPLEEAENGNTSNKTSGVNINGSIIYTLIKGLKINLAYNWQNSLGTNTRIDGLGTFSTRDLINRFLQKGANNLPIYPYPLGAIYQRSNSEQMAWTYRGGLNFNRIFDTHDITSIIGFDCRESKTSAFSSGQQYGYNPETNIFGAIQPGTWVTRPGGGSQIIGVIPGDLSGSLTRFRSYYGNLGYSYRHRYTFTASGRIDESNFFGVEANDRKKPLWSAGVKWDLSEEPFYKFPIVPILSIRATYGYSGNVNAGTSPFATVGYLSPSSPLFVPYARLSTPPNPELKWENVRTINLGLDFGINQRISGSLELYHKQGDDLLSAITVDPTSGFITYKGNGSSMRTRGIDLSLNTRNLNGLFKWVSAFNFAYQQDKVTAYTVDLPKLGSTTGVFLGKPLSAVYSFRWAGLNPMNGDAQAYLGDQIVGSTEYQNKRAQNDLVYQGQTSPPIFGSLRNEFNFKNLSVSIGITYQIGHYFRRGSFNGIIGGTTIGNSWVHEDYLNAWKVPGDELRTNVPGFLNSYPDARYGVYQNSDLMIEKGDHIWLQDIRLNYSFNQGTFTEFPLKSVNLYIYANNLGILWKASKYDPETQNRLSSLPRKRSISFGVNIIF